MESQDESMEPLNSGFQGLVQSEDCNHPKSYVRKRCSARRNFFLIATFHLLAFLLSLLAAVAVANHKTIYWRSCEQKCPKPLIHSPAYDGALYNIVTIESSKLIGSPFSGNPGPAVDKAWDDLMSRINIRISEDDLRKVNGTSIKLADGSNDYWGSIEVYHHLHCLKVIRHYIAKDYYPDAQKFVTEPGMIYPEHIGKFNPFFPISAKVGSLLLSAFQFQYVQLFANSYPQRIEHCIQTLREHLMCQPDLSIYTYTWRPNSYDPHANDRTKHSCIDWSNFEPWSDQRRFSEYDERGLLRKDDGTIWDPRKLHA
ncbi:uncharacterized protein EAF01_005661 [Botrytis porri]|uniref:uncharacterized protein n=1 Tax=Botrytis porri TaxID=87229 RepID=UPI001901606F|nr:uncharacterized protein EAF01_005661 [Botrytis porri]KAF7905140.1 hypothetical protein EAF01_005661 [Botrytis porri]